MREQSPSVVEPAMAADLYARSIHGELEILDTSGDWTVMAVIGAASESPKVVVEDHTRTDGPIVYLGPGGVDLVLPKTLEPTRQPPAGTLYNGHTKDEVLGEVDILRRELLATGEEPTYRRIAALLPPIRRAKVSHSSIRQNPVAFVGTPQTVDAHPIYYGREWGWRLNPESFSAEITPAVSEGEDLEFGIVGGWLPTVRVAYPIAGDACWDQVTFAGCHARSIFLQPVFHRFIRRTGSELDEVHYFDKFLPWPFEENLTAERFYRELYELHGFWEETLPLPLQIDVPLEWLGAFVRHAFALEAVTRVGAHPRYGTVTQDYASTEHDGFQDNFTLGVGSTVEWGMFDRARSYIDNYFEHFVRDDGSIDYRGPETGQYGRMLTNLAQYCEYSGDYSVLSRHDTRIRGIVQLLQSRLDKARALPRSDPSHGLIRGRQEADVSWVTADLTLNDYDQPYWNNSAEAWRGFTDLARVWRHSGRTRSDDDLLVKAAALESSADELLGDLRVAVGLSILTDRGIPYLPTYAGCAKYHTDVPYRSSPESFDDNRVWTEFMGSGAIDRDTLEKIVEYEASHGGSWLGMIGNREQVVVFHAHGAGFGLLQHDMIDEFLMSYFALMAHCYTRGTWTAFECCDLDRERANHTPYAAPAQLAAVPMTKWMLVFDNPADDRLWLAKATPREWLEDGKRIAVTNAPTRFGTVSYCLESHIGQGFVVGTVTHTQHASNTPAELLLRIRLPRGVVITDVQIDGTPASLQAATQAIVLPQGGSHSIRILVTQGD